MPSRPVNFCGKNVCGMEVGSICRAACERSPTPVSIGQPSSCFADYLRAMRIALRSALACLRSFFAVFTEARADVTTVLFEL